MLKIDSYEFAKILAANPSEMLLALMYFASAWAAGEPSEEECEDWVMQPHLFYLTEEIVKCGARELTFGGQHIPNFLRNLANEIEMAQFLEVKLRAEEYPATANCGYPEIFTRWLTEGFPEQRYFAVDFAKTAEFRAALEPRSEEGPSE